MSGESKPGGGVRPRRSRSSTVIARGEPQLWLTAGSLVICLAMILGLLAWIVFNALPTFWPGALLRVETSEGRVLLGEASRSQDYVPDPSVLEALPEAARAVAEREMAAGDGELHRRLLRTGNYELSGTHFEWVDAHAITAESLPEWAVVVERMQWGRFYGEPIAYAFETPILAGRAPDSITAAESVADARRLLGELRAEPGAELLLVVRRRVDGKRREQLVAPAELGGDEFVVAVAQVWRGAEVAWRRFEGAMAGVREMRGRANAMRKHEVGEVSARLESERLRLRRAILDHPPGAAWEAAFDELAGARRESETGAIALARRRLDLVERDFGRPAVEVLSAVADFEVVEQSTQGEFERINGAIDAIEREARRAVLWFDTAQPGVNSGIALVDIVRAYPANQLDLSSKVGVYFDRWWEFLSEDPRNANEDGGIFPAIFGTVLMTLLMCIAVVPFGVLAALYLREYAKAGFLISMVRIAVNNLAGVPSIVFGVFGLGFFCYIVGATLDDLFFSTRLPQPTFGKGGLLWASLTLALMTAPVVIVATEEALAAVPNSMREGSYACGASKWQTIRRIVLPRALPGIMTGAILAMARGAGEVAPLMLVGAVKLARELPFDLTPPFGANRSFMHLGFHVYDLGFQSPNSEAAKPMVYTTAFLLILTIAVLNLLAIWLRARLRRRFVSAAF